MLRKGNGMLHGNAGVKNEKRLHLQQLRRKLKNERKQNEKKQGCWRLIG